MQETASPEMTSQPGSAGSILSCATPLPTCLSAERGEDEEHGITFQFNKPQPLGPRDTFD